MMRGKNILPEIVRGKRVFRIGDQNGNEKLRVEQIHAHRRVHFAGVNAGRLRIGWFFLESDDAPVLVGFDDAEFPGRLGRVHFNGRDSNVRSSSDVLLEHLLIIHLVDVIARQE